MMKGLVDVASGSLVVVPSGQVGCASGVGLKAEGQPCPAAAKLRLTGCRSCAGLRSQAVTAPARGEERSDEQDRRYQ
jgi:hypothetical protein